MRVWGGGGISFLGGFYTRVDGQNVILNYINIISQLVLKNFYVDYAGIKDFFTIIWYFI